VWFGPVIESKCAACSDRRFISDDDLDTELRSKGRADLSPRALIAARQKHTHTPRACRRRLIKQEVAR